MLKFFSRLIIYSFVLIIGVGVYEFYLFNKSLNQEKQCALVGKVKTSSFGKIKIFGEYPYATASSFTTAFIIAKKDQKTALRKGFVVLKKEIYCVPRHNLYGLFNDFLTELIYPMADQMRRQPQSAKIYLSGMSSEIWNFLRQSFADFGN